MKSRLLFLVGVLFFTPSFLIACSCLYYTSFCEEMNPSSNVAGLQVIDVYFVDNFDIMELWIDVVVLDRMVGDVETDTLSMKITDGTSCSPSPPASGVQIGDRLAAFVNYSPGIGPNGFAAFSMVSACSSAGVFFNSGAAYIDFRDNINDCILTTKTVDKEELERYVQFAPNPARDFLKFYFAFPLHLEYTIYSASGQLIYQGKVEQENDHRIEVSDWAKGLYYVRLESKGVQIVKRFLKM